MGFGVPAKSRPLKLCSSVRPEVSKGELAEDAVRYLTANGLREAPNLPTSFVGQKNLKQIIQKSLPELRRCNALMVAH